LKVSRVQCDVTCTTSVSLVFFSYEFSASGIGGRRGVCRVGDRRGRDPTDRAPRETPTTRDGAREAEGRGGSILRTRSHTPQTTYVAGVSARIATVHSPRCETPAFSRKRHAPLGSPWGTPQHARRRSQAACNRRQRRAAPCGATERAIYLYEQVGCPNVSRNVPQARRPQTTMIEEAAATVTFMPVSMECSQSKATAPSSYS
jgi:hypothetical protein